MGKKKRRKEKKPSKPVIYSLEIILTVRRMVKMYREIARYKKPKWVCLCEPVTWLFDILNEKKKRGRRDERRVPFTSCDLCPAHNHGQSGDCNGPGGDYESVKCLLDGDSLEEINHSSCEYWDSKRKVRVHARVKANAWEAWLKEQKQLWSYMGVDI